MSESPFTPDQLAAAGAQIVPPPVGTGPADMTAAAAGGSATEVDVAALLAQMQAQQNAMAAEIARLKAGAGPQGEHRLIADARAARGLLAEHFSRGARGNAGDVLRLADDMIDAAGNTVQSGDTGPARQVLARLTAALHAVHPGPGDHHYFTQALSIAEHGLPQAADTITGPQPSGAPAVAGGAPVKVLAGSVTG